MVKGKNLNSIFSTHITLSPITINFILSILFFLSGCAALIYQIMWQRMLFTLFGVDLTSITIIVSVFMFGLGVGGLLGGYVADIALSKLLIIYLIIELAIALFGFLSPFLILGIGSLFFNSSELTTASVSFLLLAFPTILMGATFPILVTYVNQTNQHVGRSVGDLYFANTLGGAVGAYFSGFILLYSLDIVGVINHAAMLNLMIALVTFIVFRKQK